MAKLAMVLIQRLTTLKFGTHRWRKQHQRSTQTHPATKYFDTLSHQRAPNRRNLFMISPYVNSYIPAYMDSCNEPNFWTLPLPGLWAVDVGQITGVRV
jgi:hypothetical protein